MHDGEKGKRRESLFPFSSSSVRFYFSFSPMYFSFSNMYVKINRSGKRRDIGLVWESLSPVGYGSCLASAVDTQEINS